MTSMVYLVAVVVLAVGPGAAWAQQREFIGETTQATKASVGLLALHEMCSAQFPGARMCSAADILNNGAGASAPVLFGPLIWLNPTLVAGDSAGFQLDASGVGSTTSLSCHNWSVDFASVGGLVLSPSRITASSCDNTYKVACCSAKHLKP